MFKFELAQVVWYLDVKDLKPARSKIMDRKFVESLGLDWPIITYKLYKYDGNVELYENQIFETKDELIDFISN